jgi:hypothetical protein
MLPPALKARAIQRAQAIHVSLGELIREALEARLNHFGEDLSKDPLFADTATFGGDAPRDLAANHDKYLYDEEE